MQVNPGDRIAVTNAAGVRVVGTYTDPWDGVLGHVTLADGSEWAFAWDAEIEPAPDEELSPPPPDYGEDGDEWAYGRMAENFRCKDFDAPRKRARRPRLDLRSHPELRESARKDVEFAIYDGMSDRAIAREYGVSRGYVYNVRRELEEETGEE